MKRRILAALAGLGLTFGLLTVAQPASASTYMTVCNHYSSVGLVSTKNSSSNTVDAFGPNVCKTKYNGDGSLRIILNASGITVRSWRLNNGGCRDIGSGWYEYNPDNSLSKATVTNYKYAGCTNRVTASPLARF